MRRYKFKLLNSGLILFMLSSLAGTAFAKNNEILGQLRLKGASKVEKDSGVWVDGQYLGYLKELNGSKKSFTSSRPPPSRRPAGGL